MIENKDKEDPIVDIFNIIPQVRDTVIHLKVDEEQRKATERS